MNVNTRQFILGIGTFLVLRLVAGQQENPTEFMAGVILFFCVQLAVGGYRVRRDHHSGNSRPGEVHNDQSPLVRNGRIMGEETPVYWSDADRKPGSRTGKK